MLEICRIGILDCTKWMRREIFVSSMLHSVQHVAYVLVQTLWINKRIFVFEYKTIFDTDYQQLQLNDGRFQCDVFMENIILIGYAGSIGRNNGIRFELSRFNQLCVKITSNWRVGRIALVMRKNWPQLIIFDDCWKTWKIWTFSCFSEWALKRKNLHPNFLYFCNNFNSFRYYFYTM